MISVDLAEVGADLANLTLVLCSDGVWDLWESEEVFQVRPALTRNDIVTTPLRFC